ncbi:MAG: hypothetical protein ABI549_06135 [Flavobacterium sp.]|uniref:hypothetical protein n=1 Tax=Flavobacterium sp. TaxID=239 RepID=UPI0032644206
MRNKKFNFQINVKNGLLYLLITMLSILTISCNPDDNNSTASTTQTNSGTANVTVTSGGQQFKLAGPCGWAVAGGANYIGANQSENSMRTFSSYFNITQLPTVTTLILW